MAIAIKVENLSKQYRLGNVGTGSLAHDVNRAWHRLLGNEDPYLKIGEENDRTQKGSSEYVWALKDINFDVKQGEVLGVIGRNGAGKSTLLKILSRTTSPTTGTVKIKGRVASLLEVGTGFHPELNGRENIFLNGAILGMTKLEIKRKFDEIVDFAGVERYIDTPVKRYSSGMYVRLAFGVAAHLDSEILIVDEVLAVGDAEFQKKCLGKMKDVSNKDGRTVIFVSHNMAAMKRLCDTGLLINNGQISHMATIAEAINRYTSFNTILITEKKWDEQNAPGVLGIKLLSVRIENCDETKSFDSYFDITKDIKLSIEYKVASANMIFTHAIKVFDQEGINIFDSHDVTSQLRDEIRELGLYRANMVLPGNLLREGSYTITVALFKRNPVTIYVYEEEILTFSIFDEMKGNSARGDYYLEFPGIIRPLLKWDAERLL